MYFILPERNPAKQRENLLMAMDFRLRRRKAARGILLCSENHPTEELYRYYSV